MVADMSASVKLSDETIESARQQTQLPTKQFKAIKLKTAGCGT